MNRRRYLAAGACGAAATAVSLPGWGADRLRIGLTPVILADQVAFLSRWSRYLGARVGAEVGFVARESYQSVLDLLFSDQVDAAWICGYPYIRFEADLSLLAVPLYMGKPVYQAYLIRSKATSPAPLVSDWGDLRQRVLAYSDPLSNSGWLVAQAQLAKAGVMPRELKRAFFAHSHRNVADIHQWQPGMTRAQLNELLRHTIGTVKKYKLHFEEQNPDASFNPFTVIRHCLYLGDKKLFRTALRNVARQAFEAWLAENQV